MSDKEWMTSRAVIVITESCANNGFYISQRELIGNLFEVSRVLDYLCYYRNIWWWFTLPKLMCFQRL